MPTTRTPDQVADALRADLADAHTLIDESDHPRKARLQALVGGAHALLERAGAILNDDTGSGDIAARDGDNKDTP